MSKSLVQDGALSLALIACSGIAGAASAQSLQNAPVGPHQASGAREVAPPVFDINGPGYASASAGINVLHYEELTLGISAYSDALAAIGATVTFTSDPFAFETELQSGAYDAVVAAHQNSFALSVWEDDLVNWVGAHPGAPVLISDWRVNNPDIYPYLAALGFSYDLSTNPFQGIPVAGGVFDGLPVASLASPGWGIYAYGTEGGVTEATTDSGGAFVSRNGSVFFNGFLSDVFADAGLGSAWVQAELGVAPPPCPDCQGLMPGNRVTLIVDSDNPDLRAGNGGTVLGYNPDFANFIAVRWDNFHSGHCYSVGACGGGAAIICPNVDSVGDASGWWVPCEQVRIDNDCPGDVNNDNSVDIADLLEVLGNWGIPCGSAGAGCDFPFTCGGDLFFCDEPSGCICFMGPDGEGICGLDVTCGSTPLCFGGHDDCPDGYLCAVETCCVEPVCVPACGAAVDRPQPKPGELMATGVYQPEE